MFIFIILWINTISVIASYYLQPVLRNLCCSVFSIVCILEHCVYVCVILFIFCPFLMHCYIFGRNRPEGKVLEPVGVFEAPKHHGKYETGQVRGDLSGTDQSPEPQTAEEEREGHNMSHCSIPY